MIMTAIMTSMVVVSGIASAGETPSADQLFADAMDRIAEEDYEAAIPKLEEAQRLDPGIGTQFNLAVCYAKTGRLAKAWRNLIEVERLAHRAGKKQREEAAKEMLAELRPHVPHLTLRFKEQTPATKITVRVDGEIVAAMDEVFVPLERGEHTVEATAPGKKSFETKFTVESDAESHDVTIPTLPSEQPKIFRQEVMSSRRVIGSILGAIGGVGLIAFGVTGVMILSAKSTADDRCNPQCVTPTGEPDVEANDARSRAKTLVPINVVAGIVGVVGLTTASIYLFTSIGKPQPKPRARSAITLRFLPGGGVGGMF